jgi:hypothetical protein
MPPAAPILIGRPAGETQCDDLEWRDLLHAGHAECCYGFAVLNLGLQAMRDGQDGGRHTLA